MTNEEAYDLSGCLANLIDVNTLAKIVLKSREALKKQIPKKPYLKVEETTAGYACPVCDMGVTVDNGRIRETYCSHCGQALDWSDEE